MKEKKEVVIIILISFIIFLIATSIGIYLLRERDKDNFNSRINTLNNQIEQLEATILEVNTATEEEEEIASTLPVVFTPGGKFTEDEKATLMEKIVKPYFDHQEDVGYPVQAMIIEYPSSEDDFSEYVVNAIIKMKEEEGGGYGYNGELFGSTEEEYDYWYPFSPLAAPDVTEDFINDYPEVMEKYCEVYDCKELGIE